MENENEYNLPEIKSMTYAQIKAMRKKNMDMTVNGADGINSTAELVDYIMETIYPDFDAANVPYHVIVKFAMNTFNMTYGGPEAVKN